MRAQVALLPFLALSFSLTSCAAEDSGTAASGVPAEPRNPTAADDSLPTFEEYVYADELPEVLVRATPVLPEDVLQSRARGTVVVSVLVGRDGLVKDARIRKSSPPFDAAAVSSARQYVFKPARARGKPVAIWVAVPIQFIVD